MISSRLYHIISHAHFPSVKFFFTLIITYNQHKWCRFNEHISDFIFRLCVLRKELQMPHEANVLNTSLNMGFHLICHFFHPRVHKDPANSKYIRIQSTIPCSIHVSTWGYQQIFSLILCWRPSLFSFTNGLKEKWINGSISKCSFDLFAQQKHSLSFFLCNQNTTFRYCLWHFPRQYLLFKYFSEFSDRSPNYVRAIKI